LKYDILLTLYYLANNLAHLPNSTIRHLH